jgi:hypothetical protein
VTKILFIGWRAGETHFLRMLKENLPKLDAFMVVSGNPTESRDLATRIRTELGDAAADTRDFVAETGFSDFIKQRQGDIFLKA